ncbi:MAG: substrate-binding domain-containing protein [Verrucomicrobia bacterium]|nr:substrate-binding domain-containing protein [Verrucomicrobiota bacterium]
MTQTHWPRRSLATAITAVALSLVWTGCGPRAPGEGGESQATAQPPAGDAVGKKGVIGLSVLTLTNPFFKEIADSLTAEAARHGYQVSVVSGEFDPARQQNQVKDFIVRKVSALVLTPCDSKAIGPAIQEANAAGIPVFTADIACLAPGAQVVSHIATDNYGGGKEAAQAMIEALGEAGGKIAILHFPVVESCLLRVKGFREVLDQYNAQRGTGRIPIVAELPGGGVKDQGYRAAEDLLQAHPDLAGIFAINDPSALGARAALEKAGKTSIVLVGFDGQPEGRQAIRDGKIYADPIQFPDRIGIETARAIVQHFSGEPVPKEILIPTALYRKADAEKDPTLK